jgi:hypothetical protein
VVSGGVSFPSPGHSRKDRSGRILLGPRYPDGFWVASFAGDDPLPIRAFVRDRLGLLRALSHCPAHLGRGTVGQAQTDPERSARALTLWNAAREPAGTPVERYLARRGVELIGATVRYHPACPFAGERTPTMLALVRDILTDKPKAVHRTALSHDGRKVTIAGNDRLSLGPVAGGAVKLTPDEDVTTCLGIGEGIESALSLRLAPEFGLSPVWSLLSAGGVERFPVLVGIECLWIAVDYDPAGLWAARVCAERWQAAGREAFLVIPSAPRADLNDLAGMPHA